MVTLMTESALSTTTSTEDSADVTIELDIIDILDMTFDEFMECRELEDALNSAVSVRERLLRREL